MKEKFKNLVVKRKNEIAVLTAIVATTVPVFATTGDADLDTMITSMTDGLDIMAKGGVLIIGAVIGFAITFIAARWLFDLFKQWSSKAK